MNNTHLYFAYGMNTNLDEMGYRCPAALSLGVATLVDHEFRFATHADVVEYPGYNTQGVLWEITDDCLKSLDVLEGFPTYYERKLATVIHRGRTIEALVYYMVGDRPDALPSKGYLDMLNQGYKEHGVSTDQIKLSLDYIAVLNKSFS
jgi:gamma-glutamylcyclotransferase (GGCT)/AIG2-like uncharacterized protein YtfP